ncbi:hypothetical protein CGCA056_v007367 [Colletotrichum aenigma]|uniref:uncharacterized protein n=1 Tax=Colletotrichum aenigma TaxID=1215731 RepID=UPI0018729CF7|nr:uncharacterized protein CGCA056_v007367 [Colletotrichum aenigma]KAF5521605.1 hypothetical protein CGCA056_v007367 [Colletotrichum aenigma]
MASSDRQERLTSPHPRRCSASSGEVPQPRGDLDILIDRDNREDWHGIVLRARKHMRCVAHHPDRYALVEYDPSCPEGVNLHTGDSSNTTGHTEKGPPPSADGEVDTLIPPPPPPTFHLFAHLPKELGDKILLASVPPVRIEAFVRVDFEWNHGPQARFSQETIRAWRDVVLYAVSAETRRLACAAFGVPDPLGFPFSPARDAVWLLWDGGRMWAGHRFLKDCREAGAVVQRGSREWVMPEGLRGRVAEVVVEGGMYGFFDGGRKGAWRYVFGLLKEFAGLRVLTVEMWDLGDGGFEGVYDGEKEEVYRVDQLDLFDELEGMSEDGVVPFPGLRVLRVKAVLPTAKQTRVRLRFRKVNGSHFVVVSKDDLPATRV